MLTAGTLRVINPYSGELVSAIRTSSGKELLRQLQRLERNAVALTRNETLGVFARLKARLSAEMDSFARLITAESGLCLKDSHHELSRVLELITAAEAEPSHGAAPSGEWTFGGGVLEVISEPCELVYAITPFNHPVLQVAHKVVPAIVAGTPILIKPCEKTPLSAARFIKLVHACGAPQSLVHAVVTNEPAKLTEIVLATPRLEVLAFTGSHATALRVARAIGRRRPLIRCIYELGGCSPLVIGPDADIDLAVDIAMDAFRNSGQRCTTARKIVPFPKIAKRFTEALVERVKALRVGDPADRQTDVGTLISTRAAIAVEKRIQAARAQGARVLAGGVRRKAQMWPSVVANVSPKADLVSHETFGPVAPVLSIPTEVDLWAALKDSLYGLAGAVVTNDEDLARRISRAVDAGQFNWNAPPGFRLEWAPFGGFRRSGNGAKEGLTMAVKGYQRIRTFYKHAYDRCEARIPSHGEIQA